MNSRPCTNCGHYLLSVRLRGGGLAASPSYLCDACVKKAREKRALKSATKEIKR